MEGHIVWHVKHPNEHPVAEIVVGEVLYTLHPEQDVYIEPDHRAAVIAALEARDDTASVDR